MKDNKKSVADKLRGWLCQIIGMLRRYFPRDKDAAIIVFLGIGMAIAFISVMFSASVSAFSLKLFGTSEKKETLEFLSLGIGGIIALYGLVALNKRAESQIKQNELNEKRLSQESLKIAVEHLSHEKETTRIASLYEFFHLAREHKKDYAQIVLDILCSYMRQITDNFDGTKENPNEELRTLIDILFAPASKGIFDGLKFNLQRVKLARIDFYNKLVPKGDVDFSYANLTGISFQGANMSDFTFSETILCHTNLSEANLQKANLLRADLQKANLRKANLQGARLWAADLREADLQEANLQGVSAAAARFEKANLQGADLRKAHLFCARLWRANLQEANLRETRLRGAVLWETNLHGADLRNADLRGAWMEGLLLQEDVGDNIDIIDSIIDVMEDTLEINIREIASQGLDIKGVLFSETTKLSGAIYDYETKFPEGFDPTAHGMVKKDDRIE